MANIFGTGWLNSGLQPAYIGALIAAAFFLATLLVGRGIMAREAVRRRAVTVARFDGSPASSEHRALGHHEHMQASRIVTEANRLLAPRDQRVMSEIRKQLVNAGYFSPAAVPLYYATRIGLALVLPTLLIAFGGFLPIQVPAALYLILAVCLSVLGLIGPSIFLDWSRSRMQLRYRNAFPDFMDLMVICVEAGQSVQGAIQRVGQEMTRSCPELGANLHILSLELRAGRSLTEALMGLAERLGIEEVRSLALLLKQSEELGTSLGNSLRVYSDEMRDKRLMRAEEKAHALPVKMVIPLGLFIFPVIMIVIMLPLIIRIRSALL